MEGVYQRVWRKEREERNALIIFSKIKIKITNKERWKYAYSEFIQIDWLRILLVLIKELISLVLPSAFLFQHTVLLLPHSVCNM